MVILTPLLLFFKALKRVKVIIGKNNSVYKSLEALREKENLPVDSV
jgi:hypothetical protein